MNFKIILIYIAFLSEAVLLSAQVDIIGSDKMYIKINDNSLKIPVFSNYSVDLVRNDIIHAVVVLHGTDRNASDYYDNMISAAFSRPNFSDSTIIVSPQFLTEEDLVYHRLDKEHLYWTDGGWTSGSNSRSENTNPRPARITSYAVIDTLMFRLALSFPNLKTIVFAGHSAGGQVVNRYSATSPLPDILCDKYSISSKFIVANPSSYLYMDNKRIINGKLDEFGIPDGSCINYNTWRYGLDNLFTYPALVGRDSIRMLLGKRNISYLLGQLDNDPNSNSLDNSCEARLQGSHRLERGTIYFSYLRYYYGNEIRKTQSLDTIPNAGHDNFKMFTSDKALYYLFETKPISCKQNLSPAIDEVVDKELVFFPSPAKSHITMRLPIIGGAVNIYTLQGVKLKTIQNIENTEIQVDINYFDARLYIVEYLHHGKSIKKLFLKMGDF